ncbi:MAG: CehA/McbA family metallohydrolase, partial [Steroidobacterales bacterium]
GFSDPRASAAVWYRLWNCGLRPAAAAGTDAMANYSSLRGPVGLNRVYAQLDNIPAEAGARIDAWLAALKAGRTMATNGPLLALTVAGQGPGSTVTLSAARAHVKYRGFLRSAVPVDHLEIVVNGKVARALRLSADRRSADFEGRVAVRGTDWLLARAWSDGSFPDTLDAYPYATTNPVSFSHPSAATHCGTDADYLARWIDRLESAAQAHTAYNSADEKAKTLDEIRSARAVIDSRR